MNMMVIWTVWICLIIISFGCFEGYAIITGRTTLSRYVWTFSKAWPLFPWIAGVITGGLAVHWWWGGIVCFAPVGG
jgi:hypothetical protein